MRRRRSARTSLEYWRNKDKNHEFPHEFFAAVASGGWLGICMPEDVGGANLGVTEAALFMRTVAECGGQAAASTIHMNIFGLQPVVHFGTDAQKAWLPPFARASTRPASRSPSRTPAWTRPS